MYMRDKPIFSSDRMLLKEYDHKGLKTLVVSLKGLDAKTN
jgi:hypothetical protein